MNRRAFTITELLTSVTIIAILAGILFPVFAQTRAQARQAVCMSNVRQISAAALLYAHDYDEFMVCGSMGRNGNFLTGAGKRWPLLLYPYIRNVQVYSCPSTNLAFVPPTTSAPVSYADGAYAINLGYSANPYIRGEHVLCPAGKPLWTYALPSKTLYFADGGGYMGWTWTGLTPAETPVYYPQSVPPIIGAPGETSDGSNARFALNGRHRGGATCMFADGHAKWLSLQSLAQVNSAGVMWHFTANDDQNL